MDPITITAIIVSVVSAVGTVVLGVLQILKGGLNCSSSSCLNSECCSPDLDIHDNENVHIK